MPNRSPSQQQPSETETFRGITAASMEVAIHDLLNDEGYAQKVIRDLGKDNFEMAMELLALAKEAQDKSPIGEQQFLMGALTVIAAKARSQENHRMNEAFAARITPDADAAASDLLPAV